MRNLFSKKRVCTLLCSIFLAVLSTQVLPAAESPSDKISEWIKSSPWIGLVAKEVTYGPITLGELNLDKGGRLVIAKPGEEIKSTVKYKINADKLDSWHLHHIVVGIKGQAYPTCITHSFGVWDKKGKASFTLIAPKEKGVYEVRFNYQEGITCSEAVKGWLDENSPSAHATVGIIIVE